MRHDFADGKYTVINDNGKLTALRYGEPWPARDADLIGDNLVAAMLEEVDRLMGRLDSTTKALASLVEQFDAYRAGWLGGEWVDRIGLPDDLAHARSLLKGRP